MAYSTFNMGFFSHISSSETHICARLAKNDSDCFCVYQTEFD